MGFRLCRLLRVIRVPIGKHLQRLVHVCGLAVWADVEGLRFRKRITCWAPRKDVGHLRSIRDRVTSGAWLGSRDAVESPSGIFELAAGQITVELSRREPELAKASGRLERFVRQRRGARCERAGPVYRRRMNNAIATAATATNPEGAS